MIEALTPKIDILAKLPQSTHLLRLSGILGFPQDGPPSCVITNLYRGASLLSTVRQSCPWNNFQSFMTSRTAAIGNRPCRLVTYECPFLSSLPLQFTSRFATVVEIGLNTYFFFKGNFILYSQIIITISYCDFQGYYEN